MLATAARCLGDRFPISAMLAELRVLVRRRDARKALDEAVELRLSIHDAIRMMRRAHLPKRRRRSTCRGARTFGRYRRRGPRLRVIASHGVVR